MTATPVPPPPPDDLRYARLMLATEAGVQHHSWVHRHVSAYCTTSSTIADLELALVEAFLEARGAGTSRTVDQDGEMRLDVSPNGHVRLMLPWREFEMEVETTSGRRRLCDLPREEVLAYLAALRERVAKHVKETP